LSGYMDSDWAEIWPVVSIVLTDKLETFSVNLNAVVLEQW